MYWSLFLKKLKRIYERSNLKILFFAALGVFVLLILLVVWMFKPGPDMMKSEEILRILDSGVLRVGVRADQPGFSLNSEGFEIELAKLLQQSVFKESAYAGSVELVPVTQKTIGPKLDRDQVDVVIALSREDKRSTTYLYSQPYYTDVYAFLVKTGKFNTLEELQGKAIGVLQSSAAQTVLSAYNTDRKMNFVINQYASYEEMKEALLADRMDAAAMEQAQIIKYADKSCGTLSGTFGTVNYSITCTKAHTALAKIADNLIAQLEKSGELDALIAKYSLPNYSKK